VLRRKEALPEGVVQLEIRQRGKHLQVIGANPSDELTRRITRMLQLDVDTSEFAEMARASERHAWVAETGFGRLLCGTTVWEDAVKIIATTNTTWAQTVRMVGLLVEKCGRDGAFPTPQEVLRFSEEELQRDCRLGYRAKSIRALASGLESGAIDLLWSAGVSPAEQAPSRRRLPGTAARTPPAQPAGRRRSTELLFKHYQTLPGIGPYGAAHLLAMDGRHDFIAVDSEFRRFVRETYHRGKRVSDQAMLRRYNKWGRWKYLAYWSELWSSVAERLQPRVPAK
jgi:3-methyladenine DNA glycosylase/8-oxoguanine DNA glycosylase